MSELTINQLRKLIIGFMVVAAVIVGLYLVFKNKIFTFFGNNFTGNYLKSFFALLV